MPREGPPLHANVCTSFDNESYRIQHIQHIFHFCLTPRNLSTLSAYTQYIPSLLYTGSQVFMFSGFLKLYLYIYFCLVLYVLICCTLLKSYLQLGQEGMIDKSINK